MTNKYLNGAATRLVATIQDTVVRCDSEFSRSQQILLDAISNGLTIFAAGNGGSAATASHFTAELVGRYKAERRPLAAISLNADTPTLTAIANDYGYENVFGRQVEALGQTGDVLVVFTTSGQSDNILRALKAAWAKSMVTIMLTGLGGAEHAKELEACIVVPSRETARIQEAHDLIVHAWCEAIDAHLQPTQ